MFKVNPFLPNFFDLPVNIRSPNISYSLTPHVCVLIRGQEILIFLCFQGNPMETLGRKGLRYVQSFYAIGLCLYPLKKSENKMCTDVFKGYRKRPVA